MRPGPFGVKISQKSFLSGLRAAGRTKTIAYASGVATTFSYSPTRLWLTRLETLAPDGTTRRLYSTYTRDLLGRVTAIAEPGAAGDWSYSYDVLDRLTRAQSTDPALTEDFVYQPNGNLVSRSLLPAGFSYLIIEAVDDIVTAMRDRMVSIACSLPAVSAEDRRRKFALLASPSPIGIETPEYVLEDLTKIAASLSEARS